MSSNERQDALHQNLLCEGLDHGSIEALKPYLTAVTADEGTVLYSQGDEALSLFLIEAGRVELVRKEPGGKRQSIALLRNGDFFGEGSILGEELRENSAIAVDDTRLRSLDASAWKRLSTEHPVTAAKILGTVTRRLRAKLNDKAEKSGAGVAGPRVVTFFSATGGVGKTFLASNLAAIAARDLGLRVCLVELDLQFGNLGAYFGFSTKDSYWTKTDLEVGDGANPRTLFNYSVSPFDNLFVFLRPPTAAGLEGAEVRQLTNLVRALEGLADLVVLDTPVGLDETCLTALDVSDRIFLVTTAEFSGVAATGSLIRLLHSLHYDSAKLELIVNQSHRDRDIPEDQWRTLFTEPPLARLPWDWKIFQSVNANRVFGLDNPAHPISRQLRAIADTFRHVRPPEGEEPRPGFIRRWLPWIGDRAAADEKDRGVMTQHTIFEESGQPHKRSSLAEVSLGQAYYLIGRYDVARHAFEKALEIDRSLSPPCYYLAEMAQFDGNEEEARYYYRMAIERSPESMRYMVKLAVLDGKPDILESACKSIKAALVEHPNFADYHYLHALTLFRRSDAVAALEELDRALGINPAYVEALTLRGLIQARLNRFGPALESLLEALRYNAGHVPALFELGKVLTSLRLYAFAHDAFHRVLNDYPGHMASHKAVLDLKETVNVLHQEVRTYTEAVALHPKFGDLHHKLAVARYQLGEFAEARIQLEEATKCHYSRERVVELLASLDAMEPVLEKSFLLVPRKADNGAHAIEVRAGTRVGEPRETADEADDAACVD